MREMRSYHEVLCDIIIEAEIDISTKWRHVYFMLHQRKFGPAGIVWDKVNIDCSIREWNWPEWLMNWTNDIDVYDETCRSRWIND